MDATTDLEQVLKAHKRSLRIGDKRLADLANDYAGIPLVNRSSVRNWSDGTAKVVRDWRPLVAIAAALRLDEAEANVLLRAGDCRDLRALAASHPGELDLLRFWMDSDDTDNEETIIDITTAQQADDTEPRRADDTEPRRAEETEGEPRRDVDQPPTTGHRRWIGVGGAAVLGVSVVGLVVVAMVLGRNVVGAGGDVDAPVATEILTPPQGAVVGEGLVASGRSTHPTGVSHVDAVLVDIDRNIYWNPKEEVWQQKWRVFTVPVAEENATEAAWKVDLGKPVPLLPGSYRFRVWSRTKSNRGDPVGPLVEFTVSDRLETLDDVAFARAERLQNNPVPDPAFELEAAGAVPIARVRYPHNGSSVLDGFRLLAEAKYEPGLESMSVELRDVDTDEYWNFEAERWQGTPIQYAIAAADADCSPCQELAYDVWMPSGSTPPGNYVMTTRAVGSDGATYPEGTTAEFSVIGP